MEMLSKKLELNAKTTAGNDLAMERTSSAWHDRLKRRAN
jgi:hypothetical protein